MISKVRTLFYTIIKLKPEQVLYQVWYRIKNRFLSIKWYQSNNDVLFSPIQIPVSRPLICSEGKITGPLQFSFLNRSKKFLQNVNWNFIEYGKLWNYNLQYFDFLHDQTIPHGNRIALVENFSDALLNGYIKPEPYPISLRLINWIIFSSETNYKSRNFSRAITQQAAYLRHNIEYHIQANHLLENYIALCFCELFFNDEKMLNKWFSKMKCQLDIQVLADGGHYECSPMYHAILVSRLLILYEALAFQEHANLRHSLKGVLTRMTGWLKSMLFRSGLLAHVNDATDGVASSTAHILGVAEQLQIKASSLPLLESGYRKMNSPRLEVLIDVGDIMPPYQPGHAHADMLSFVLECNNRPVIVDAGISTYENSAERQFQRSTAAHNTVTVDGQNQSEVWGSFRVGRRAKLSLYTDLPENVVASHNGYKKGKGLTHIRSFYMYQDDSFCVTDKILGNHLEKPFLCQSYLHFDHALNIKLEKVDCAFFIDTGDLKVEILGAIDVQLEEYDQALAYNVIVKAKVLKVNFAESLDFKMKAK